MSQARLSSCIPLPIEHKTLVNVIEKAKDWALMHGVGMRDKKHFNKDVIQVIFLLFFICCTERKVQPYFNFVLILYLFTVTCGVNYLLHY